jgi:uncharacterized protein (DUF2236 family)
MTVPARQFGRPQPRRPSIDHDAYGIVHRLNGERIVVLSWSRAILMQLAHPLIAAGVAEHSAFRGDVAAAAVRLRHTVGAMRSLTFGDPWRQAATLERIRAIHRRVHGTLRDGAGLFAAGTPYSAEDPALLLWVHATLVDSVAAIYQRLVGPLDAAELDAFCAESVSTLIALGGDVATAPRTWAALREYLLRTERSGVLVVSATGHAVAHAVLFPRAAGLQVPCLGWHRLLTTGLLPVSIRRAYGFDWSRRRARRFARLLTVLRALRRVTPDVLARWPEARRMEHRTLRRESRIPR